MTELVKGKATICVANYKTLQDESLAYLKSLGWIRLIERQGKAAEPGGGFAHAAALDLGLNNSNTEFFISMHSDTFVKKAGWLTDLISYFGSNENNKQRATSNEPRVTSITCVGSGKIEPTPKWRILLKKATDLRTLARKLLREPDPIGKFRYYNRTICCLYRTDILRRENLSFLADRDKGLTGGKKLYFELIDRGYRTVELPSSVMSQFVYHLAHATQVVNPQEFTLRKRTIKKCTRLIYKVMSSAIVQSVLADDSLDK
ncbi:hypothetical protein ES703_30935 [subsurface metagenome]